MATPTSSVPDEIGFRRILAFWLPQPREHDEGHRAPAEQDEREERDETTDAGIMKIRTQTPNFHGNIGA